MRKYSYADVLLLRVMAKLLAQGISVLRLRKCLTSLQKRGSHAEELITKKYVITDGYNVYFGDRATIQMMDSGQMEFAFILDLISIRNEVAAKQPRQRAA